MADEKTPLQNDKKAVVDEKTGKAPEPEKPQRGVQKGTKRGPYKTKKAAAKKPPAQPEVVEPEYTEQQAQLDSEFLVSLINQFRTGAGLPEMKQAHRQFPEPSSKAMFLKYGSSASRWMPEVMFTGSLLFVGVDTLAEMRKKRALEAQQKAQAAPKGKAPEKTEQPEKQPVKAAVRDKKGKFTKKREPAKKAPAPSLALAGATGKK